MQNTYLCVLIHPWKMYLFFGITVNTVYEGEGHSPLVSTLPCTEQAQEEKWLEQGQEERRQDLESLSYCGCVLPSGTQSSREQPDPGLISII